MAGELRFFFITSDVQLAALDSRGEGAEKVPLEAGQAWVAAAPSTAAKCVRCWHHREDVGRHPEHPELCGRCVENVDGSGEERRWF